jgi:hypothetical protein
VWQNEVKEIGHEKHDYKHAKLVTNKHGNINIGVSGIKLALLTEIYNSDRRRQIHAGKDGRRLVEERGQIQLLCFFSKYPYESLCIVP